MSIGFDLRLATSPTAAARPAFARVTVEADPARVVDTWRDLEAVAPVSPYQTSRFLLPWIATLGTADGVTPFLVTAHDRSGRPIALLPLGMRAGRVVRSVSFLGGKHVNYAMGLFRPDVTWRDGDIAALLREAARVSPVRPDLFALRNQPHAWDGVANPLAALPHQPSPSAGHRTALCADPAAFLARHKSPRALKSLGSKRARLAAAAGPLRHTVARTEAEVDRVLQTYLAQKIAALDAAGLPHDLGQPGTRAFLRALASPRDDTGPALELHALLCGDRIVATFGGVGHAGRFSGLIISYDAAPILARSSPGELLLVAVLEAKCLAGLATFDLGIGEARYKSTYCQAEDPLFDSLLPVTPLGHAWAAGEASRLRAKRWIKQSPRAWAAIRQVRGWRAHLRA